jgi:rhodanese-related sulfurtransferase
MIRFICRISLSPDSCVGTTQRIYSRWGAPSLIVAKFIPGFAALATTLAGQTRTGLARFAFYDGIGAALWASVAVVTGAIFHEAVNDVLMQLESLGRIGLILLLVAITAFVLHKVWKRQRFIRLIQMARISPTELHRLMGNGNAPLVLDVRPADQRRLSGWIPGAIAVSSIAELDLAAQPEVIIYCDCPNEASAALLARQLKNRGFRHVRPLAGGFEAWNTHGLPVAQASQDDC